MAIDPEVCTFWKFILEPRKEPFRLAGWDSLVHRLVPAALWCPLLA